MIMAEADILDMIADLEYQLKRLHVRQQASDWYQRDRTYKARCGKIEDRIAQLEEQVDDGSDG